MKYAFAFQPIVDISTDKIISYEILLRGENQESAFQVLSSIPASKQSQFIRQLQLDSIKAAARLNISTSLNINFPPDVLMESVNQVREIMSVTSENGFEPSQIVIEITETAFIKQHNRFISLVHELKSNGFQFALDDFGAGYSGLNLLADFQPDIVKLDMHLIRGIERHGPRQAIVRAVFQVCFELGIDVIAEGVETAAEFTWLKDLGITLYQGYLFARPGFECLPPVTFQNW